MGQKRTVHLNLPRGMRARVRPYGTYYFLDTGEREIPLGKDYVIAVRRWAEHMGGNAQAAASKSITFRKVAEAYLASPKFASKAPRTQKDNIGELNKLYAFFDEPPAQLDAIEPHHIAKYRDWRKSTHSTHEIALLSAIWSWAREQGYTAKANPTTDVERNKGKGRGVYVSDALYRAVYEKADQATRDAMDLAHLAGQRPGDNLRLSTEDIVQEAPGPDDPPDWDGRALYVVQGKTKARLRVRIIGELAKVVDRILERKAALGRPGGQLCVNEEGAPLTASALDGRFGKARLLAGVKPTEFQMRDLRAKAGTEVDGAVGQRGAQELLGHTTPAMTNTYIRHRKGRLVNPNTGTGGE